MMYLVQVALAVSKTALVLVDGFGREAKQEPKLVVFDTVRANESLCYRCTICGLVAFSGVGPTSPAVEIERALQPHADDHRKDLWP